MDPKRTAVIVLAAIAAIVVLISVIAGAIAVLPRDEPLRHRDVRPGYAPSTISGREFIDACGIRTDHTDHTDPNARQARLAWPGARSRVAAASFRTRPQWRTRSERSRSRAWRAPTPGRSSRSAPGKCSTPTMPLVATSRRPP